MSESPAVSVTALPALKVVESPKVEPKLSMPVANALLTASIVRFTYGKRRWWPF